VGDVNGDGIPDLAIANNCAGSVSVLGRWRRNFARRLTSSPARAPASVAIGMWTGTAW
jgi:hypothetical protein